MCGIFISKNTLKRSVHLETTHITEMIGSLSEINDGCYFVCQLKEDLAGQEVEDEGHEEEEEPVHTHTPEEQLHTWVAPLLFINSIMYLFFAFFDNYYLFPEGQLTASRRTDQSQSCVRWSSSWLWSGRRSSSACTHTATHAATHTATHTHTAQSRTHWSWARSRGAACSSSSHRYALIYIYTYTYVYLSYLIWPALSQRK